jgi:hypothetical protein
MPTVLVWRSGKIYECGVPFGDEDISYGGTSVKNKCLGNLMFFINTRQPGETPQLLRVSVAKNTETRIIPSYVLLITLKTSIS